MGNTDLFIYIYITSSYGNEITNAQALYRSASHCGIKKYVNVS